MVGKAHQWMKSCTSHESHPISIPILLMAIAIQAILPDAHDLASLRALNLVFVLLPFDLDCSSDDCEPSEEVCGPIRCGITFEMRELIRKLAAIGIKWNGSTGLMIGTSNSRCTSLDSAVLRFDDLIHFLCRLIC
jgi:hypothetical protein